MSTLNAHAYSQGDPTCGISALVGPVRAFVAAGKPQETKIGEHSREPR